MANAALAAWYTKFLAAVKNLNNDNNALKSFNDKGYKTIGGTLEATTRVKLEKAFSSSLVIVLGLRASLVGILSSTNNPRNTELTLGAFGAINLSSNTKSGLNNKSAIAQLLAWTDKYIKPLI